MLSAKHGGDMAIPFSDEDYRVLETYLKNTIAVVDGGEGPFQQLLGNKGL
jgi:hypothetical protein